MKGLTVKQVASCKEPGRYADRDGLYLNVAAGGTKSWIFRSTVKGRTTASGTPYRVEVGLGSTASVTLQEAREKAAELKRLTTQGLDPLQQRKRETLTFDEVAEQAHEHRRPTWRNEKHAAQWISTIKTYASPTLGKRPIEEIGTADVLHVLQPIWTKKPETARRLKQRLSVVFDWAKVKGHYSAENPVNGLRGALVQHDRQPEHMVSLAWKDLPAFMVELAAREGISARALEFTILTAARSGEVRGARWSEIQGDAWIIPANRMKAKKEHRVPLTKEALAVLGQMRGLSDDLVFPSPNRRKDGRLPIMSDSVFRALYKRMKQDDLTTHGFRTTFRVWCAESAHADREVAEASLAHAFGSKVEQAYARTDLFDRRRTLMERWSQYATGTSGTVVHLARA